MLISKQDLATRKGRLIFFFEMKWLSAIIKYPQLITLGYKLRRIRYKFYGKEGYLYEKDRFTGKIKEVGRFGWMTKQDDICECGHKRSEHNQGRNYMLKYNACMFTDWDAPGGGFVCPCVKFIKKKTNTR